MSISWTRLPFRFENPADYARHLSEWIGQAFYERLPAAGYQVREEQIYFAFRVAAALQTGRAILAEAGSGTGKTFGYLLPAICYARLRGRPVVLATATPALQQQLAGQAGDVAALSGLLDLRVDARVALRPEEVVCDIKVDRAGGLLRPRARAAAPRLRPERPATRAALLRWAAGSSLGARSEFPAAPDALWAEVAWDRSCRCDVCPRRGFCRLTRARESARAAADLVVCSHDLFFEDTFGRDRLPPGRLPVLPPFSAVVFDEGHRVALAAQRAAGARLHLGELGQAIDGCEAQGVRIRLLRVADAARAGAEALGRRLRASTAPEAFPGEGADAARATRTGPGQGDAPGAAPSAANRAEGGGEADAGTAAGGALRPDPSLRLPVTRAPELVTAARALKRRLADLQDEMTIEEGLHEETAYAQRLGAYHARLDAAQAALAGLGDPAMVPWVEDGALWVVPRDLGPLWRTALSADAGGRGARAGVRPPLVFSSATLSAGGSFTYTAASLGLPEALTARVGVPFRLARQVLCYLPADMPPGDAPDFWDRAAARIARLLGATAGRALILLPGPAEQHRLRGLLQTPHPVLWEGDAAPERLVAEFTRKVSSCLAVHTLWEGIDVPGASLSAVIVPQLPLPGNDPVVQARREAARAAGEDPLLAVDLPDMTLRLKQGVGRLIRTETDRGVVALLDGRCPGFAEALDSALPEGARRVRTLAPVARFLRVQAAGGPA